MDKKLIFMDISMDVAIKSAVHMYMIQVENILHQFSVMFGQVLFVTLAYTIVISIQIMHLQVEQLEQQ